MKILGFILITFGMALSLFVGYLFYQQLNRTLSPVPQDTGIKVIFITPTP